MEKQLLSVLEFAHVIGVGETAAKKLIREKTVLSVKVGDRRLIPTQAVQEYVDRLIVNAAG